MPKPSITRKLSVLLILATLALGALQFASGLGWSDSGFAGDTVADADDREFQDDVDGEALADGLAPPSPEHVATALAGAGPWSSCSSLSEPPATPPPIGA